MLQVLLRSREERGPIAGTAPWLVSDKDAIGDRKKDAVTPGRGRVHVPTFNAEIHGCRGHCAITRQKPALVYVSE